MPEFRKAMGRAVGRGEREEKEKRGKKEKKEKGNKAEKEKGTRSERISMSSGRSFPSFLVPPTLEAQKVPWRV